MRPRGELVRDSEQKINVYSELGLGDFYSNESSGGREKKNFCIHCVSSMFISVVSFDGKSEFISQLMYKKKSQIIKFNLIHNLEFNKGR